VSGLHRIELARYTAEESAPEAGRGRGFDRYTVSMGGVGRSVRSNDQKLWMTLGGGSVG
jgi:hypothetical protein